jgi:hypothetical protein
MLKRDRGSWLGYTDQVCESFDRFFVAILASGSMQREADERAILMIVPRRLRNPNESEPVIVNGDNDSGNRAEIVAKFLPVDIDG